MSVYWTLSNTQKGNFSNAKFSAFGPAPQLQPTSRNRYINVLRDHHWTESPVSSRIDVPVIKLEERRILTNPMLNQIAGNVMVATDTISRFGNDAATLKKQIQSLINPEQEVEEGSDTDAELKQLGETILDLTAREETRDSDPLNPYKMLYTVQNTEFNYVIPYMENQYKNFNNDFGENVGGNVISDIAQIAAETAGNLSLRKMREPGRMIEQPKGFNFSGREKQYTTTFPLFNTKNKTEIEKNWSLLFLLTYQNTPNRITRDLVDPPCIYQASIPGVWYSKYAAITNMTVDFRGARRMMNVNVSNSTVSQSTHEISTIIPDAYQVTLTLTELFAESQNFLFETIKQPKINVEFGE